ncbi:hypothetical protein WMZ97_13030 [Lentibacillus sp. N15]
MMIKAGTWNSLSSEEKMDLLIHFSYHNPMKPAAKEKDRTAMRSVVQKIS